MNEPPPEPRPWRDALSGQADDATEYLIPPEEEFPAAALVELTPCWRCGKEVEVGWERCPHCQATLIHSLASSRTAAPAEGGTHALVKVLVIFLLLLGMSLVFGWVQRFGFARDGAVDRPAAERHLFGQLVVEGACTVLVGVALFWIGRLPSRPSPPVRTRLVAWLMAGPVLAALLVVNVGYHELLRHILRLPLMHDELVTMLGLSAAVWFAYCLQPAVVEEVFFRYLSLDALRATSTVHSAVWVSAVMFGLAHIFNPLGMPYLVLLGVMLGYARVVSGSLLLPVLLHFAHNAVIILLDRLL